MDIGFIGLGHMGFPMAARLAAVGHRLFVYDTHADALAQAVASGAHAASSPRGVADRVDTVLASLPSPQVSLDVATGSDGIIAGSKVKRFVDLSTVGSPMAQRISKQLAERAISMLDCPVSGGVHGAGNGTLAMMVSGPRPEFDATSGILETLGRPIFVSERAGAAQTMKLVNNMMAATALAATAEVVVMGVKAGLDAAGSDRCSQRRVGRHPRQPRQVPPCGPSAHVRLRVRDRSDGQGRAALSGRSQGARLADRYRGRGSRDMGDTP